jgi:hypothetical protein
VNTGEMHSPVIRNREHALTMLIVARNIVDGIQIDEATFINLSLVI